MEVDIITAVMNAEAQAAEMQKQAEAEAAAIILEAEKRAMELTKASESACAQHAEEIVKKAHSDAEEAYHVAIEAVQKEAAVYAESCIEKIGPHVLAVVGRILK